VSVSSAVDHPDAWVVGNRSQRIFFVRKYGRFQRRPLWNWLLHHLNNCCYLLNTYCWIFGYQSFKTHDFKSFVFSSG